MNLSPGDTIQIILTVGGVPYAKTYSPKTVIDFGEVLFIGRIAERMTRELVRDIDLYANETESANEETVR